MLWEVWENGLRERKRESRGRRVEGVRAIVLRQEKENDWERGNGRGTEKDVVRRKFN